MDGTLAGVASIPLFIELKNDVDSIMSLNDNSLSQQIEFILQDPITDRTPPVTPKLNIDSNGHLITTAEMIACDDDVGSGDYQLMDPTVIKVERMDEDDDVGREEEITTLSSSNTISTNTEECASVSLMAAAAISDDDDDEDGISPSSSSVSSSSMQMKSDRAPSYYLTGRDSGVQATGNTTNYHHRRTSSIEQGPTTSGSSSSSSSSCSSSSSNTVIAAPPNQVAPPPAPSQPQEFQCFECVEKFDNKELFEIHKTGHANNMKCAICNMVLKSLKNYEKHCLRCKPYECQICGRVVRFRPNFIKHMRVHTGQQSERHKYKCDVCLKEFMSFEYFKVHKKIHNDNVNLTCEICGKVFSALASLRGHSKLHSGVKLHKCDVCGKGFGQRYNLKIHARTHTGDFPFECKICKKKLHTQSSLQTHMQIHQKDQTSQVTTTIKYEPLVAVKVKVEPIDQTQMDSHQQQELQRHQQLLHQHEMLIQPKADNATTETTENVQMYTHSRNNNIIHTTTANATTNTIEESSNESQHDNNMTLVIKNDVQNGPSSQVTYAQQQPQLQPLRPQQQQQQHNHQYQRVSAIIKSTATSMSSLSQSPSSLIVSPSPSPSSTSSSSSSASSPASIGSVSGTASTSGVAAHASLSSTSSSIRHTNENSPSLATTALIIKSEPNLYSSGDNSVDMFIKKEIIFDECSAPSQNSPPTSKFHTNFDGDDLVDAHDLTHSLPYSNLFEPNSIPDSMADDLYPDDPDDFRLDHSSLGLQSSTTDGDFIKKEWVYGTGSGYTINGKFDDDSDALCDPANFIYN